MENKLEYIYFAKSEAFPNLVKIGRTDRDVSERMSELSNENYGPEGFKGEADWEAVNVIQVTDNTAAENLLHEHFADLRVSEGRELFETTNPELLFEEANNIVGSTDIVEAVDIIDIIDGVFPIITLAAIGGAFLSSYQPNSEAGKVAEKFQTKSDLAYKRNIHNGFKSKSVSDGEKLKGMALTALQTPRVFASKWARNIGQNLNQK